MLKRFACIVVLVVLGPGEATAQTCSCAGVPILGAMQSASPSEDQWFIAGTWEYHDISELVSGSSTVPDQTNRNRTANALVIEASRGVTDKWSVSVFLSMVEHERDVSGVSDSARGIGDALLMAKYSPKEISLYEKSTISMGIGARGPIGDSDASSNGVALAEDLQPSTGAYGGILWFYTARALNDARSGQIYLSAAYTYNGENDRDYQFGHATTASIGGSYQTQSPWGVNVELIYRHAERDRRASVDIPNTGGKWLDVEPAVQYHLNESLAVTASVKIPITRDLNDELQFTSKYAVSLSVAYVFGKD